MTACSGIDARFQLAALQQILTIRLGRRAAIVVSSALLLTVPLYLWRIAYPRTDWAITFLAPLALLLLVGSYKPRAVALRATHRVIVREESWVSAIMTGRVRATVDSIALVVIGVPILAWQALGAPFMIASVLLLLCAVSSGIALGIRGRLLRHFNGPFAACWSYTIGAVAAAIVFIPILAWINWGHILFPGEFRTLDFLEAVQFGVAEQLPPRRGWIAEILSVPIAIESAQLWLTANYGSAMAWLPVLYGFCLALVAFVVARASTALTCLAELALRSPANESTSD